MSNLCAFVCENVLVCPTVRQGHNSQLYSLSRCLYVPLLKHLSVCSFQPVYKPDHSLTAVPLQPPENHTSATNANKHKTVITNCNYCCNLQQAPRGL